MEQEFTPKSPSRAADRAIRTADLELAHRERIAGYAYGIGLFGIWPGRMGFGRLIWLTSRAAGKPSVNHAMEATN